MVELQKSKFLAGKALILPTNQSMLILSAYRNSPEIRLHSFKPRVTSQAP